MALVTGDMKKQLKTAISTANQSKQDDADKAIDDFCNALEEAVDARIKSMTITILPGAITVVGSATAQANAAPIDLDNSKMQIT